MKKKNRPVRKPDHSRATTRQAPILGTGAVWFALSLSLSALTAGTTAAPLGAAAGAAALITGQLTGGFLLYLAGRNGEITGKKSTEAAAFSFGQAGASFFAVLNLIQMTGWSAFLIRRSAGLISGISEFARHTSAGRVLWIFLTGILILFLLSAASKKLSLICTPAALVMLALLTLLCLKITENDDSFSFAGYRAGFGDVAALSASLPLFWLPVVSDYTSVSFGTAGISAAAFTAGGCAAALIGMAAAFRYPDIPEILASSGFSAAGILLILVPSSLSAFFCLRAAGVNSAFICDKIDAKKSSVVIGILAVLFAAAAPADRLLPFLRFISAAFLPMTAILTADLFLAGHSRTEKAAPQITEKIRSLNIILWIFGFFLFHFFTQHTTPLGSAFPTFLLTCAACIAAGYLSRNPKVLNLKALLWICRAKLRKSPDTDIDADIKKTETAVPDIPNIPDTDSTEQERKS